MTQTPFPVGWKVTDLNNRPLHNAKVWATGDDGSLADNWLDPKYATPGQRVRRTNGAGQISNGSEDGRPFGFHLKDGDYTIHVDSDGRAPPYDFPCTISAGGTHLVIQGGLQHMAVQPAHLGVTIQAGGSGGREMVKPPEPAPARLTPVADTSPVHIREATRKLINQL